MMNNELNGNQIQPPLKNSKGEHRENTTQQT